MSLLSQNLFKQTLDGHLMGCWRGHSLTVHEDEGLLSPSQLQDAKREDNVAYSFSSIFKFPTKHPECSHSVLVMYCLKV